MSAELQKTTLCANQHQRQVGGVPVVGEAAEVVIDGLKADLVLQAEDEDDSINPQSELQRQRRENTMKAALCDDGWRDNR